MFNPKEDINFFLFCTKNPIKGGGCCKCKAILVIELVKVGVRGSQKGKNTCSRVRIA